VCGHFENDSISPLRTTRFQIPLTELTNFDPIFSPIFEREKTEGGLFCVRRTAFSGDRALRLLSWDLKRPRPQAFAEQTYMRDRRYAELTKMWRDVLYWNVHLETSPTAQGCDAPHKSVKTHISASRFSGAAIH
jgi:hypothetical protein